MTEAAIIGWAHSPFGKLEGEPDLESLIARVARAAIEDAGISPAEIDAGFVGIFGEGFTAQGFPASLLLQSVPEMRFRPITRYENACATGSAAIHGARDVISSGRGRFALVVGPDDLGCRKPDPWVLREVGFRLGAAVNVFVGDSDNDIAVARAVGIPAIGVAWGLRPQEIEHADIVVPSVDELVAGVGTALAGRSQTQERESQ